MKQKIEIKIATIEKNRDHAKIKFNLETDLVPKCGLVEPFIKLIIKDVATPLLEECEDDTHTPEMGTWESSGTPKTSKFDFKGQNTSP
jgi:hypothetical protein